MGRRSREPDQAEWLRNIQQQPENVARLLVFESRFGGLRVDEHDYVWSGGGTSFKLIPQETPPAPFDLGSKVTLAASPNITGFITAITQPGTISATYRVIWDGPFHSGTYLITELRHAS